MSNWTDPVLERALKGSGVALRGAPGADAAEYVISPPPPGAALRMLLAPEYWIPESYARGGWALEKGDLGEFTQHMMDRTGTSLMRRFASHAPRRMSLRHLWQHWITPRASTRSVKRHYDIDYRVYEHILDPEMVYTAAFFDEADDLAAAQQAKMARILERLTLPQGARILDIGCGWGSLARHIVRARPDVQVTGITISQGQLDWANAKNPDLLKPSELARIDLRLQDLRDHAPQTPYDAVVSVGLFEHVGRSLYRDFFEACARFCASDGTILMHTIAKNRSGIATNRWIDRHIFPGGYIASLAEIARASERAELDLTDVFLHAPMNYGLTCRAWRKNLMANREAILGIYTQDHALSLPQAEQAYRIWEIYLAGAEAGFLTKRRPMQTAQFVFKPTGMASETGKPS